MWTQKLYNKEISDRLTNEGVLELISTIISGRGNGIKTKSDIGNYVGRKINDMDRPYDTEGMEKAVKILRGIIKQNPHPTAVIFGDYDVDGITSSYMCSKMLTEIGCDKIMTYIPMRVRDGYGLNDDSVRNFITKINNLSIKPDFVMVLDCGTSSNKYVKIIKDEWKSPLIIVDHHIIDEKEFSSLADAVVNPRLNNSHPFCTAGLMFQFARALLKPFDSNKYSPYAALGTVADVCIMQGSNRILVYNGIEAMKEITDYGISALISACNIKKEKIDEDSIGFSLAPAINSSGRLSDPMISYSLLSSESQYIANNTAEILVSINDKRKQIQRSIMDSIESQFNESFSKRDSIVAIGDWHVGIVGIVAGQLAEKYNVPVMCFGKDESGKMTGSGRSKSGVNIKEAMDKCSEIFIRYGGHEMAAGATLNPDYIDKASELFDVAVKNQIKESGKSKSSIEYDTTMTISQFRMINNSFCEKISMIGPFGQNNSKPVFRVDGVTCKYANSWNSNKGGSIKFSENDIDSFAMVPDLDKKISGKRIDILFTIERSFKDDHTWSIKVRNARLSNAG